MKWTEYWNKENSIHEQCNFICMPTLQEAFFSTGKTVTDSTLRTQYAWDFAVYTYWLGMKVISLLLSPRYQLLSEAKPRTIVGTEGTIKVLLLEYQVYKCFIILNNCAIQNSELYTLFWWISNIILLVLLKTNTFSRVYLKKKLTQKATFFI